MDGNAATPRVSVIMANYNGAAHIAVAIRSVLRQSERALELIISDDGSTDASLSIAREAAGDDARLVLLASATPRTGPAAARNRALAAARGKWIAVVDNDDFIHPERLERLIGAAEADHADIAADDLLVFYQDGSRAPHAHLRGELTRGAHWISAAEYEHSNRLLSGRRALGYLKPVFRRELGLAYDESLRIGEDSELVLRLLAGGARMRVYPQLGYFYRKHSGSISHRLDAAAVDAMEAAYRRLDLRGDAALAHEVRGGLAALADARAFANLVAALKARNIAGAIGVALRRPGALKLLRDPIGARLRPRPRPAPIDAQPRVTLLSRQRIVGSTNGSSAYVLALAGALKRAGYAVDYLGASPKIFGRWAVLRLKPETAVFDRYVVHGGVRVGSLVLAKSPSTWATSLVAALAFVLRKVGFSANWSRPADYAQGAGATHADMLFVARHASRATTAVLCDYAFLAPLAPYAVSARRSLVIMHDLMSARVADMRVRDPSAINLTPDAELHLLSQADTVVAIQADEAAWVRTNLPSVVIAAHAAKIAPAPQPGEDDKLLFVGSNTAPNIVGLTRFYHEIWPSVVARRPAAKLTVAGSVARAMGPPPQGVNQVGVVSDLDALYAEAGVVISPLYTGSGLKIKLIEAMAAGKATVGTSITAQGVRSVVRNAIEVEDDPARFADAVVQLLGDAKAREELGEAALFCARTHFSPERTFDAFVAAVRGDQPVSEAAAPAAQLATPP